MQKALEPLQNMILRLAKVGATAKDEQLTEVNLCLADARKTDAEMRARLFVLQVARKYDLATAHKMSRRKAGEFDDPDLAKVLEEMKRGTTSSRGIEKGPSPNPQPQREAVLLPGMGCFNAVQAWVFKTWQAPWRQFIREQDRLDTEGSAESPCSRLGIPKGAIHVANKGILSSTAQIKSNFN